MPAGAAQSQAVPWAPPCPVRDYGLLLAQPLQHQGWRDTGMGVVGEYSRGIAKDNVGCDFQCPNLRNYVIIEVPAREEKRSWTE